MCEGLADSMQYVLRAVEDGGGRIQGRSNESIGLPVMRRWRKAPLARSVEMNSSEAAATLDFGWGPNEGKRKILRISSIYIQRL